MPAVHPAKTTDAPSAAARAAAVFGALRKLLSDLDPAGETKDIEPSL
jgi:hypothetical protein